MATEGHTDLFSSMPDSTLAERLTREFIDASRELVRRPSLYLWVAFIPESADDWLSLRLARRLKDTILAFASHPVAFIAGLFLSSPFGMKRRRWLFPVLAVSVLAHFALGMYLIYSAVFLPYSNFEMVSKPYKPYKEMTLIAVPPPRKSRGPAPDQAETLEDVRKRDREKAEREKNKKEAEKEKEPEPPEEKKDETKKADEGPSKTEFGEINVAPIKDIVGRVYAQYKEGKMDLAEMNFTIMAAFEIERDGSLSAIKIIQSSGSKVIDEQARAILHAISESHALSPIHDLSSNTIRLELDQKLARLTITGFAPSENEAKAKTGTLRLAIWAAYQIQKSKDADAAELLSLLKVNSDSKRVDAVMMVSRARATEMMRARFGVNPTSPPQ